jgi:hypothetical protein
MDKKTIIDKIKNLFSEVENGSTEVEFVDVVTTDGIVMRIKEEEVAEGVEVMVVDADGVESIAPAGDYTTEDKVISIDESGKVASIKDVEEDVEEEATEEEEEKEEIEAGECSCEGQAGCECDKYEEVKEEEEEEVEEKAAEEVEEEEVVEEEATEEVEEEVDETMKRLEALEKALSNLAENMSAIEILTEKVAKLSGEPADKEVKLSKTSMGITKSKLGDKFDKLKELSKYRK